MGLNIADNIEFLALLMGLCDAYLQVLMVEFIVANAKAISRLPGVNRIGTIGECIAHILKAASR
jgi:hypothetical protein